MTRSIHHGEYSETPSSLDSRSGVRQRELVRRLPTLFVLTLVSTCSLAPSASAQPRTEHDRLQFDLSLYQGRELGRAVAMSQGEIATDMQGDGIDTVLHWGQLFGSQTYRVVDSHDAVEGDTVALSASGGRFVWAYGLPSVASGDAVEYLDENMLPVDLGAPPKSIAVSGSVMAVGVAPNRVAIYRRLQVPNRGLFVWVLDDELSGGLFVDYGRAVALSDDGDVLAIGAPGVGFGGGSNGFVEIWVRGMNDWILVQTIDPPMSISSQQAARFGSSLSMADPWLAVGAPKADRETAGQPIVDAGQVLLYDTSILYVHQRTLFGAAGDQLGASVAMARSPDGSLLLVAGAPFADQVVQTERGTSLLDQGAAVTHRWTEQADDWQPAGVLVSSGGGTAGANLGTSVATDGRRIVVGAPHADVFDGLSLYEDAGVALVFLSDQIFADGFETGNASRWSAAVP
ncbi:MAG: hypothetical protein DWQ36_06595 [Acidobacteria bacterium]|nr:MAG: hypothetical protein DWQ30_08500 [Acidobacteriota bacterium]REK09521.1 MAG: hypothetical protein DWQ36_06595 [Acidobacteriota bacterium]